MALAQNTVAALGVRLEATWEMVVALQQVVLLARVVLPLDCKLSEMYGS